MSLSALLDLNKNLALTSNNRIRCSYSGHEMPPRADVVQQYLSSKKFMKARDWYSKDFSKFQPHVVQDKHDPLRLYCRLTKQSLNKIPEEIEKHVQGKRFRRLKLEFESKSNELKKNAVPLKSSLQIADEEDEETEFWKPPPEKINEGIVDADESYDSDGAIDDEAYEAIHEDVVSSIRKPTGARKKRVPTQRLLVETDDEGDDSDENEDVNDELEAEADDNNSEDNMVVAEDLVQRPNISQSFVNRMDTVSNGINKSKRECKATAAKKNGDYRDQANTGHEALQIDRIQHGSERRQKDMKRNRPSSITAKKRVPKLSRKS